MAVPTHGRIRRLQTFDKRKSHYGKTDERKDFVPVTGGGNCSVAAARIAMGIDWMNKGELNEAIPPAYTQFIGRQLLLHLSSVKPLRFLEMRKPGSKEKIRQFLLANKGHVVTSIQIRDAAGVGVSEWARRVRELREDEGWPILTHNDSTDLKPGQYLRMGRPAARARCFFRAGYFSENPRRSAGPQRFPCRQMCGLTPGEIDR